MRPVWEGADRFFCGACKYKRLLSLGHGYAQGRYQAACAFRRTPPCRGIVVRYHLASTPVAHAADLPLVDLDFAANASEALCIFQMRSRATFLDVDFAILNANLLAI